MIPHYLDAQETWEATPMPTTHAEANNAQRELLLQHASREDLIAMVVLLDGELKDVLKALAHTKAELASATMAARLNMETIKAMRGGSRG